MRKTVNLIGQKFGRLTVVEKDSNKKSGNVCWKCLCDCGTVKSIVGYSLTKEDGTRSCGCLHKELVTGVRDNICGKKFGKLTVISLNCRINKKAQWKCVCDCGNFSIVDGYKLKSGHTKSCGCIEKSVEMTGMIFGRWTVIRKGGTNSLNGCQMWACMCECDHEIVHEVDGTSLRLGKSRSCGCLHKEILKEAMKGKSNHSWRGGVAPIHQFLRKNLIEWKKESMKKCKYKCVITGDKFHDIHHLHGFDLIIEKIFIETGLVICNNISDYSERDLSTIVNKCLEIHTKHQLGVCLRRDIHILFHNIYGYGQNTKEQFEEFTIRFKNGEFENNYTGISIKQDF